MKAYRINAFTDRSFAGNPAIVCPLEAWLPDETLQAIAIENHVSETAFFIRSGEAFELRWFAPASEVELCGHATLAAAFAISTYVDAGRDRFEFRTRWSGTLGVKRNGDLYTLDFPARAAIPVDDDAGAWSEIAGTRVVERWVAVKTLAVCASEADVARARPQMDRIAELPGDGLILTAPGSATDFVARYFAPHRGVPEDPVTGSAYCSLAPYWSRRLGRKWLTARQLSKRGGELTVEHAGERVFISGRAIPYFVGEIAMPQSQSFALTEK
jgi:predicted PhzF superfamily epimerase YddE/YHI9